MSWLPIVRCEYVVLRVMSPESEEKRADDIPPSSALRKEDNKFIHLFDI